jgi:hypothetical protein
MNLEITPEPTAAERAAIAAALAQEIETEPQLLDANGIDDCEETVKP